MHSELNKVEREKYINLYEDKDLYYRNNWGRGYPGYGQVNHGKNANQDVLTFSPESVLDVGCGDGKFCVQMVNLGIKNVYGVDIASVATNSVIRNEFIKYYDSEAHELPFDNNFIDVITSFDVLEHCLEKDVDKIVDEFHRVCKKGLVLKIAYRQATEHYKGVPMHMTVKTEDWWIAKFSKKFICTKSSNGHLICTKI